ncbi:putative 3-hydroxyacyl- protein [Botryosphaeria dothidea]|uniref:3-hydroxyacyl- protein n=1 Tax=Botryosphaeria dothidea TaxID=55169 RepID=A0A8H4IJJ2_9PEZI|nr:putative 3-hydroxyacyl- protein [Botryosphaeria dothidea]
MSSSSLSGSPYILDPSSHANVSGKVVVISGAANGIGAALARALHAHGTAALALGDTDAAAGQALAAALPGTTFVRTDVRRYGDVVTLFKAAKAAHGRVDAAVGCAGVLERGMWFGESMTPEGVEEAPDMATVEVNLQGGLYFARVACGYLNGGGDKALVLVSSAAGFRESPGLPVYQTTKTGLLGLARNLSLTLHPTTGIRTNILLPAMTETGMVGPAAQLFRTAGLAINSAEDVAAFMVDMIARKERNGKALNGLAVYVEGGRGWEIEEGLKRTMKQWLGAEPVERIEEDKRVVEAEMWGK